ncbi:hypothetical protein JYU34_000932 [Plutella xylostella]|uniref:Uncharacterized protein n=1 Tax=Plutella xylostella TaxID=51655 RepID=A0ABQ7R5R2_PLUXY|nr:hypothetical protein JYU34_000932 [Plutella xylostella]
MDNTKKLLLVEPEFLEKIKQSDKPETTLTRLDDEMNKILNSKVDDREKWTLYLQTLQRYLHFTEEERQPLITMKNNLTENSEENIATTVTKSEPLKQDVSNINYPLSAYTPSHLLKLIPKTYLKKGELLLENILQNKDRVNWNDRGEVTINNQPILHSNIVDLINDVLRPLKRAKPRGWEVFSSLLHDIKVPLYCIGNPANLNYINSLNSNEINSQSNTKKEEIKQASPETEIQENYTPKLKNIGKISKKIDWERWTPY